jgi:hypothetical protein
LEEGFVNCGWYLWVWEVPIKGTNTCDTNTSSAGTWNDGDRCRVVGQGVVKSELFLVFLGSVLAAYMGWHQRVDCPAAAFLMKQVFLSLGVEPSPLWFKSSIYMTKGLMKPLFLIHGEKEPCAIDCSGFLTVLSGGRPLIYV